MDSNLTLRSNIYINRTGKAGDIPMLQHITDYKVLKRMQNQYIGYSSSDAWMTDLQKQILRQGSPECSYEKGTKSWGVPIGGNRMHCRCEQRDCKLYKECSQYWNFDLITREIEETHSQPAIDIFSVDPIIDIPIEMEPEEPETIIDEPTTVEPQAVAIEELPQIPVSSIEVLPVINTEAENKVSAESRIVQQEEIINANLTDRIWVNAGPGTGKTYTVIQRLKYLLNASLEKPIVVLCFSRNAVQVVRERLADAIGNQAEVLMDDGQLLIRTFDSFATYMLEDELNPAWDYNRRIEEFIKMLGRNHGALDDAVGYLVVDEIQDTVGVRGRMLLAILDELSCGALLLGDQCQAIFDWTIRDEKDMSFDELVAALMKRKFYRYELDGNRRQAKELASLGQQLRSRILKDSEEIQEVAVSEFKDAIRSKWKSYSLKALSQIIGGGSDLIITKTNGEAAHISQALFENTTDHMMKQSTNHRTLASWIAKVLCGNDGYSLTRDAFMRNATDFDIDDPESKWIVLKSLDKNPNAPTLHIPEVLSALVKMDGLPDVCLNQYDNCTVVSTIHRAKGSEAEHVYWLDGPLLYSKQEGEDGAKSDAIRASYVAATRAKKDIHLIEMPKNLYMRTVRDTRWIKTGFSKNKTTYCKGIALLPDDVDPASFAEKGTASETQMILSCLERGVSVELYPNEGMKRFDIYFDGQPIGYTSATLTGDLFAAFDATNHNRNWPAAIKDVFVTAVTTIVGCNSPGVDCNYSTSGCWLGIELGGFPIIEWY